MTQICPANRCRRRWLDFAALVGLVIFKTALTVSGGAEAATATDNLSVQIVIQAECIIVTTTAVDFGTEGVLDTAVDTTGAISVQCSNGQAYDVGLDAGTGSGATTSDRNMTGPASATIDYSLFRDAARTQNWGDTVSTDTVTGTGNGAAQNIDVYGRVPAQTTPGPGTYTDTVLVTVTYN